MASRIVLGADVADVVKMLVEEALPIVRKAPRGDDAAAAADHAAQTAVGQMHVLQADAAVYGEIVHTLFALLYQRVAEQFPGQFLSPAAHLLHGLVHGHGTHGHGAVADDPLAGLVDVVSGREVHEGVSAPLAAPDGFLDLLLYGGGGFLDLLLYGGGGGGVADVGVDLHQEVAADDHGLGFRVVDVGRQGCPSGGYLVAHELRGDVGLYAQCPAVHVLADGHVLHLGSYDALLGEVHLGNLRAFLSAVGQADMLEAQMVQGLVGQPFPAVLRGDLRQLLHLPLQYPLFAEPG